MRHRLNPFLVITLCALAQTSPIPLRAWILGTDGLAPAPFPTTSMPIHPPAEADFNGDGTPEILSLMDGQFAILSSGETVWQSPPAWTVVQAAITDLNRDGQPEATLLLWRPFQPWPVDRWLAHGGRIADFHDAAGNSCHLILIGWKRGGYREIWAGSALADPITAFAAADLNGDHAQELATLEGRYANSGRRPETFERAGPAQALKIWEWNGFGFTILSSLEGTFSGVKLVQDEEGHILILTP